MPSQEEYLDNLLKGIETENTETEVTEAVSYTHLTLPTNSRG